MGFRESIVTVAFVLAFCTSVSYPAAAGEAFPALGSKRLFMSSSERQNVYADRIQSAGNQQADNDESETEGLSSDQIPVTPVRRIERREVYYNGLLLAANGSKSIWIDGKPYESGLLHDTELLHIEASGEAVFRSAGRVHRIAPGRSFIFTREYVESLP